MMLTPEASTIRIPHDWTPRTYQRGLWDYLEAGGRRAVAAWHRRSGKDSVAVNWTAVAAMQRVGVYYHMAPEKEHARKIIWDNVDAQGRRVIDQAFPKALRETSNENEMKIRLANGSVWQVVGSDSYDSLVGTNPVGLVFSEYSRANPAAWDFMRPILAENGGWALFISTPLGQNHFADLYETAKATPGWFAQVLTVDDTQVISPEALEADRADMVPSLFKQEYFCSFAGAVEGSYYGEYLERAEQDGRIASVPWEPALPVNTAWDLGVDDQTSIWFWQRHGKELRLIDYYKASGAGFDHYAKHLAAKPYAYGQHLLPHDIEVREMSSGRSRKQELAGLGIKATAVPRLSVEDGIQAVRSVLAQCWFDASKCARGIKALKAYRTEYDPKTGTNRQRPQHDWTSHAADAFRYLAVGLQTVDRRDADAHRPPPRVLHEAPKGGQQWVGGGHPWDGWFMPPAGEQAVVRRNPRVLHEALGGGASEIWRAPPPRSTAPLTGMQQIEKIPVGSEGHYIVPGAIANDGRQLWGVHLPDGAQAINVWGRDKAERAVAELCETGSIDVARLKRA
jgi:hypothetical protein